MLSFPASLEIYLYTQPTDMRKGFDSLAEIIRTGMQRDPLSGQLFVFRSKRGDRVKLLWWDRDGWALVYKRLEEGVFRFPAAPDSLKHSVLVSAQDLSLLLWGIDPTSVRRQKRYSRPA